VGSTTHSRTLPTAMRSNQNNPKNFGSIQKLAFENTRTCESSIQQREFARRRSTLKASCAMGGKSLRAAYESGRRSRVRTGLFSSRYLHARASSSILQSRERLDETRINEETVLSPPLPRPDAPAIHSLPSPDGWAMALELGAKGDGSTDDTAAL